jgi:hypothetical protein
MTKEEYSKQLSNSRWFRKRNKILARDKYQCQICKSKDQLNVHHLYYVRGKKAWEYPHDALITWCSLCHEKWHSEHELVVREKIFSEGKKRKFKPPVKVKVKKVHKMGIRQIHLIEFQKLEIPTEERKILQKIIRRLSTTKRRVLLDELKIKY